jgi:hypothetical protein
MNRLIVGLLATLAALATLGAPTPAYATPGDLTCTVSSVVTYSPGLRLTTSTQYVTFDVHYGGCTSTTGATVSTADISGSYSAAFSCLTTPQPGDVAFTIPWNDSTTTDVEGTAAYTNVGGQSVYTTVGSAVGGRFNGDTYVEAITEASLDLRTCLTTGVTSQTGTGVVTFA